MLQNVKKLHGFTVGATDGEIGAVKDVYFDDSHWVIRYLVVETGGWLSGRKVLISPRSVREVRWADAVIQVDLTLQQVRDSPGIDTDKPVSRQHEVDYSNYYGYPSYWEGANLWGLGVYPIPWVGEPALAMREREERLNREPETGDSHLRSSEEVIGYDITASDGSIGEVGDFIFDDQSWAIRYLIVDTRKWWAGKHVLLAPAWIDQVSWPEHTVFVSVTRKAVETSPQYDPTRPPSREHEAGLHDHYARPAYWD